MDGRLGCLVKLLHNLCQNLSIVYRPRAPTPFLTRSQTGPSLIPTNFKHVVYIHIDVCDPKQILRGVVKAGTLDAVWCFLETRLTSQGEPVGLGSSVTGTEGKEACKEAGSTDNQRGRRLLRLRSLAAHSDAAENGTSTGTPAAAEDLTNSTNLTAYKLDPTPTAQKLRSVRVMMGSIFFFLCIIWAYDIFRMNRWVSRRIGAPSSSDPLPLPRLFARIPSSSRTVHLYIKINIKN